MKKKRKPRATRCACLFLATPKNEILYRLNYFITLMQNSYYTTRHTILERLTKQ